MKFTETQLPGVFLVELEPRGDERGYFSRVWCEEEFRAQGLNPRVAQVNTIVSNLKGTLRGLHFQRAPHSEAKFVRCLRGAAFDVAVDLRTDSPNFMKWFGIKLKAGDGQMLYVPEGFGHGFQTLEDQTEVMYQATTAFAPDSATGVRYNDPAFKIEWPLEVTSLSEADAMWPDFDPQRDGTRVEIGAGR